MHCHVSSPLHACLCQLCMCCMGRAFSRFMPCTCCMLSQLVCYRWFADCVGQVAPLVIIGGTWIGSQGSHRVGLGLGPQCNEQSVSQCCIRILIALGSTPPGWHG